MDRDSKITVELHCHSSLSDGRITPESLVENLVKESVRFASLTDHDTVDGLDIFETACRHNGIGFIPGIELTTILNGRDIHLLGYGFDRHSDAFSGIISRIGKEPLNTRDTILRIHDSGGIAVMAHPFATEPEIERLEKTVKTLSDEGLDGIEVFHPSASADQQNVLLSLAAKFRLIISGGSDYHGDGQISSEKPGTEIPVNVWRSFREALSERQNSKNIKENRSPEKDFWHSDAVKVHWRRLITWMVMPALTVLVLFLVALFVFFLPGYEKELIQRKRETIKELTNTVWSMLNEAEQHIKSGADPEETRSQAAERIRSLRYGPEEKDYFWIQDLTPKMIVHPYRPDLDGKNIGNFKDSRGVNIFSVFADIAGKSKEGYADYVWQWKDDPGRQEAKESYIKLFEPWGWIIGTGIYIQDVTYELSEIKTRLIYAVAVISFLLTVLLLVMIKGGLIFEKQRRLAEKKLHETNSRYISLVHAAAEGVLFVKKGLCSYANPVMLELIGCTEKELGLMEWNEIFPELPDTITESVNYFETPLLRRDGTSINCFFRINSTPQRPDDGFVCIVRRSEDFSHFIKQNSRGSVLQRLLKLPASIAGDIAKDISSAADADEVVMLCRKTPSLVSAMLSSGVNPQSIVKAVTAVTDAATRRFIELKQQESGVEPVPFAFIALGSQGREEQTLFTDQDNALIYHDDGMDSKAVSSYFLDLSSYVCENLVRSGYRPCRGKIMAENIKWCQPLNSWKKYFSSWINDTKPHDLMELNTFLDLRCVAGNPQFVSELHEHIFAETAASPSFFVSMATEALSFKAPLRLFGNLLIKGAEKENSGLLDLKAVMMPVVNYARLFSLKYSISAISTEERLAALSTAGHLLPTQNHDILTVFESLLRLRLNHQSLTIENGHEPDNLIDPAMLGNMDDAILNECFNEIDIFQEHIKRTFLGGAERIG